MRVAVIRARQLRADMTDAERKLWQVLGMRQVSGFRFRRQFPLGPYIVDFLCLETRLIVELDGGQHQEQRGYDEARDAWLRSQKFAVLRVWNNDVLTNIEGVMERISHALTESTPPSRPSPVKGEGEDA